MVLGETSAAALGLEIVLVPVTKLVPFGACGLIYLAMSWML